MICWGSRRSEREPRITSYKNYEVAIQVETFPSNLVTNYEIQILLHPWTCLHINRFLIEKKLFYPNVEDSIFIFPWIHPVSDYYDFSEGIGDFG